jgi:plastocyanin
LSHWYAAQRACGIRVRGLYSTKDTFVTLSAAQPNVTPLWLEQQTGVAWATLRRQFTAVDHGGDLRAHVHHRRTFPYYCSVHFSLGMTGTITVQ